MDAIDAKIRKLQIIRELASDPEALAYMREIVRLADNGTPASTPATAPERVKINPEAFKAVTEAVLKTRAKWGEQQRMVEETLRTATEPVTTEWIAKKMQERGYTFIARTPTIAVNDCLRLAKEKGRARIAKTEGVSNFWIAV
jgi:hypothetical protein